MVSPATASFRVSSRHTLKLCIECVDYKMHRTPSIFTLNADSKLADTKQRVDMRPSLDRPIEDFVVQWWKLNVRGGHLETVQLLRMEVVDETQEGQSAHRPVEEIVDHVLCQHQAIVYCTIW